MRIITWNVNGLRAVVKKNILLPFLEKYNPDIFLIQETKANKDQLQFLESLFPEYVKFYGVAQKPGYSGVGVWIRKDQKFTNIEFFSQMPQDPVAEEGRIGRINFLYGNQKFSVLSVYFPNGGKSQEAWYQKLGFYDVFLAYVNEIRSEGWECIWAGDVNCAHHEIDLARPKENDGVIGFHPEERSRLDRWESAGWRDVWRHKFPNTSQIYSWWHLITRARSRNVGWRIDYAFVDDAFLSLVDRIEYLTDEMGSDHCPLLLETIIRD